MEKKLRSTFSNQCRIYFGRFDAYEIYLLLSTHIWCAVDVNKWSISQKFERLEAKGKERIVKRIENQLSVDSAPTRNKDAFQ